MLRCYSGQAAIHQQGMRILLRAFIPEAVSPSCPDISDWPFDTVHTHHAISCVEVPVSSLSTILRPPTRRMRQMRTANLLLELLVIQKELIQTYVILTPQTLLLIQFELTCDHAKIPNPFMRCTTFYKMASSLVAVQTSMATSSSGSSSPHVWSKCSSSFPLVPIVGLMGSGNDHGMIMQNPAEHEIQVHAQLLSTIPY